MKNKPINIVINQDCIIGMADLPENYVDLIITDPPYNLSKGNIWKWDNSVVLAGMGGIGIRLCRIGTICLLKIICNSPNCGFYKQNVF